MMAALFLLKNTVQMKVAVPFGYILLKAEGMTGLELLAIWISLLVGKFGISLTNYVMFLSIYKHLLKMLIENY